MTIILKVQGKFDTYNHGLTTISVVQIGLYPMVA
jgi:hypothetical protein